MQLRLDSGRTAGRLATPQFEGGELRLGRAALAQLALGRNGGCRIRKFVGNIICLGRERPAASALRSAACRTARRTSPFRSATMPSALPLRESAREVMSRAPPRPSAWQHCEGGSRLVLGLLASTPCKSTRWARDGFDNNPPIRQARPPKRVATARRRLRWGQKKS